LPGLDDGPEYSPDGKYIWFNSVRSGLMQVWRMDADGSNQTHMVKEDANCWFPHVSPDGKWVVYIAYQKDDVAPGDHPANKNVELRLIPVSGGESKTIVKLFGGQGTININS
jgi:Tol biopolymer transport system component